MNAFTNVLIDEHNEGKDYPMNAQPPARLDGRHAPTADEFLSILDQLDEPRRVNALIFLHMIAKSSAEQMERTIAQAEGARVDYLQGVMPMPVDLRDKRLPPLPAEDRPVAATPFDTPPLLTLKEANKGVRKLADNLHPAVAEVLEAHDTIQDFRADAVAHKEQRQADLYRRAASLVEVALDLVKEAAQVDYKARRPTPPPPAPVDPKAAVLAANDELSDAYCAMIEDKEKDTGKLERTRKALQLTERALDALSDKPTPPAPMVIPATLPELLTSMNTRLRALEVCSPEQIDELTALQVLADRAHELADRETKPARKPRTKKPEQAAKKSA